MNTSINTEGQESLETSDESKNKNPKLETKFKYIKIAKISVLVTLGIWALSFFLLLFSADKRGTFGDMFGAVNALFSGLAFAGLIITLIMQHEELGLQRQEIAQTNKELEAQRKEFKAQTTTMKIQRFENTLFNLLSLQEKIVDNLFFEPKDSADPTPESKGRYVFDSLYNSVVMCFGASGQDNINGIKGMIIHEDNINAYKHCNGISVLDHYFRHLYHIFKYIDDSPLIEDKDRYNYACIVRAQLSDYELLVLFYNALNVDDNGELKFKRLIETYAVFNNIREEMLARKHNDYKQYNGGAYSHPQQK